MVPYGYTVELYDGDGFKNAEFTVEGQMFADENLSSVCFDLVGHFDDKTASLIIYRNTTIGPARGRWVGYTSTEQVDFTVHYGFETSHSESESSEQQFTLSYEMTSGIEFEGATEEETISRSYSSTIQKDTEDTYTYDVSVDVTVSCTAQRASDGVGLWQWVVDTNDGTSQLKSLHTVCRYGSGYYNSPPACPWNACSNGECTECATDWIA